MLILAYKNGYTAGTYNVAGGNGAPSSGGNGGNGGNGQIITYQYINPPVYQGLNFSYTSTGNILKNRNATYAYEVISTTSTSPVNLISETFTPQSTGLVMIRVVAKVYNNTIGDGVSVTLLAGSNPIDADTYTQEGLANNPHYIVLYNENLYPIGTQQTFSVQFNAITGGTAYCEIQEFSVEEVY